MERNLFLSYNLFRMEKIQICKPLVEFKPILDWVLTFLKEENYDLSKNWNSFF